MGDVGEMWKAVKEHRQKRKYDRLAAADATGWTKHTEYHWSRMVGGKKMDYWPSTNKVHYDGKTMAFGKKRYQEIMAKHK